MQSNFLSKPKGLEITAQVSEVEAAIQLFREGEVTLGRAAEIAGLTRWEFDTLLADRGITRVVECNSVESR